LSIEWCKEPKKEVMHIHIVGNLNKVRMKKCLNSEKFAVNKPRNVNYEIIDQLNLIKVNKAINYLRWIRSKHRPNKVYYNLEEATNLLKVWKCSYGIQKSIDRFIIWKYAIKWEIYAEMLFNGNSVIMNGYGNRKKKKKIDLIFSMISSFQKMFKMKSDRICNIFNQKNSKHLVRKAVKKKKKFKNVLCLEEEVMNLYLEKVNKNWKTRRKKSSDKIANIKIS
jgi:hypothetical protein